MRKRLLTILMIVALIMVMGPMEMFATDTQEDNTAVESAQAVDESVDEVTPVPDEEAVIDETGEAAADETAIEEAANEEATDDETADDETESATAIREITVAVDSVKADSVMLSWQYGPGQELAEGQTLAVLKDDEVVGTVTDATVMSFEVTGLTPNTEYIFTVRLGEGEEAISGSETVKTLAEMSNFRTVSSYKTIILRWDALEGAAKYIIKYVDLEGNEATAEAAGTETEWVHQLAFERDIINLYNTGTGAKVSGNLDGKDRYTYTITAVDESGNVLAEATETGDVVKTLYYKLTFKNINKNKTKVKKKYQPYFTLTSKTGGSKKETFRPNQVVYAYRFEGGGAYYFDYMCSDGKVRTFRTLKVRVNAALSPHLTAVNSKRGASSPIDYTVEEAEQYVNDVGVTKGNTNYMIWANQFTQKEYIFKRTGNQWKIVTANGQGLSNKVMAQLPISSGKATSPTALGSTKINRKGGTQHGIPYWNVCNYFSVHGVAKKHKSPGYPESGACVRNLNANAKWIYKTVGKKSRVYVY